MRRWASRAAPLGLALVLFVVNNLAVIGGWVAPPEGYVPAFINRGADFAVYQTWLTAFERETTLPDYHAPWQTEAAFFNALPFLISRTSRLVGLAPLLGYYIFHLLFYVIAVYALGYAVRTFTQTAAQARAAWVWSLLSVPITSLLIVPAWIATWGRWSPFPMLPGIGDFVFWSSDGLFHGISGSIFVTFGTATTVLAFAYLARYLQTDCAWFLVAASLTIAVSALVHPYEVVVIASAGGFALVILRWRRWVRLAAELSALGAAGLLGVLPLSLVALQTPWVRAAAEVNRWAPQNPLRLLMTLGIPTIVASVLLVVRPRMSAKTDLLLQLWFACTLVGVYVPWMHWSQHLLDGFLYGAAILIVRQVEHSPEAGRLRRAYPRLTTAAFVGLLGLSLIPYIVFPLQSFEDGRAADPERLFSAVASRDEQETIGWMKRHARAEQLVLAPPAHAPWFATVPMHSFASHFAYSLTYREQRPLAEDFYAGRLTPAAAAELLLGYGVRYVVVPKGSPAVAYLRERPLRAEIGSLQVYELAENAMKPYSAAAERASSDGFRW